MGALASVRNIFHDIRQVELCDQPKKSHLFWHETSFLGNVVSAGVSTGPAKISVVRDWPVPRKVGELQSFSGLTSCYQRFVRLFHSCQPTTPAVTQKVQAFQWSKGCALAFTRLRSALVEAPVLTYSDLLRPFIMDTDANNVVLSTELLREGQQGGQIIPSWVSATSVHNSMGKGSSCALTMHLLPGSSISRNLKASQPGDTTRLQL